MSDLAAETRRLLDAATPGPWHCVVDDSAGKDQLELWCDYDDGSWREGMTAPFHLDPFCYDPTPMERATAALIAAAPRLLANWLARTEALGDYWGSVIFRLAAEVDRLRAEVHQWEMSDALQRDPDVQQQFIDTLTAERDRLTDENRALREAILDAVTELGLAHEPDWASDKAKADGKDPVWCRICGPADGSWPCTSQMVVTDLLAAADRGVTDGDRNEGDER